LSNLLLKDGFRKNTAGPGSKMWREKMSALWNYLHRDMSDARVQRALLYPETWDTHVQRVVPFVWRVAREMASMKRARTFLDPKTGDKLPSDVINMIESFYKSAGVDSAMTAAYGQLVTLNQSTIWLLPKGSELRCVTLPPHEQWVEMNDPLAVTEDEISAWNISIPTRSDPHANQVEYTTARWTKDDITWNKEFDKEFPAPFGGDGKNQFGAIPVVFLAGQTRPLGTWWCQIPEDILDAQRAINHDLTDIGHIARLQGYGQMYSTGLSTAEADNMKLGPEAIIALPDVASRLDFARAQPDLKGYAEQNEQYLRAVISSEGLSPSTFLKSSGITALAKKMEQIDRDTERLKYLDELERAEQRVYDLMRSYYLSVRGVDVFPPAIVSIEFREPVTPADPLHDAQAIELLNRLGVVGKVASRARLDGVSTDEAMKRMIRERKMDEEVLSLISYDPNTPKTELSNSENNIDPSINNQQMELPE